MASASVLSTEHHTDSGRRRAAVFVATLSSFLGPFMGSSVNVALPAIGAEFSMGAVMLGWINTAFLLAAATFLIPFGRLGDLYGRKLIFILGVGLLALSSALLALAGSGGQLITIRVFQGISSAMVFATAMPLLIAVVPAQERGRAIGYTIAAVYLGLSTGPFFGGFITQYLGWRYIFGINVPLGLSLLVVAVMMLRKDAGEHGHAKFDYLGSLILAVGLLLTMYGFSNLPSAVAGMMVLCGLVVLGAFVGYESRLKHPLVDMMLFRKNTIFAFSNLAALINYAATFAVTFLLSLYLQKVRLLSPQAAGIVLVAQPIVMTIFSPLAGRLSDRIEPRTLASWGMGITALGLAMLAFLAATTPLAYIVASLIVLGFGFALFSSPNTNAIMSAVDRRMYGVASSVVSAMRQIGMMFSMGIVAMLLSVFIGSAQLSSENAPQFLQCARVAFAVFAALCCAGVFASLARGKVARPGAATS